MDNDHFVSADGECTLCRKPLEEVDQKCSALACDLEILTKRLEEA